MYQTRAFNRSYTLKGEQRLCKLEISYIIYIIHAGIPKSLNIVFWTKVIHYNKIWFSENIECFVVLVKIRWLLTHIDIWWGLLCIEFCFSSNILEHPKYLNNKEKIRNYPLQGSFINYGSLQVKWMLSFI